PGRGCVTSVGESANRLDDNGRVALPFVNDVAQRRRGVLRFERPETARGKGRGEAALRCQQHREGRDGTRITGTSERKGDGPPRGGRGTIRVNDAGRKALVGAEPHERVQTETDGLDGWRQRPGKIVRRHRV